MQDRDASKMFDKLAADVGGYNKMVAKEKFWKVQRRVSRDHPFTWTFVRQLPLRTLLFGKDGKLIDRTLRKELLTYTHCVLLEKKMRTPISEIESGKVYFADGTTFDLDMIGTPISSVLHSRMNADFHQPYSMKHPRKGPTRNERLLWKTRRH